VQKRLENLLRQHVNPDNLTAVLGQVEVAEALSVCSLMDIDATKSRRRRKVVLRMGVTFQIADKTMNDRTWMTSALEISRHLSWCFDDVN
jgi:hypothetical protein